MRLAIRVRPGAGRTVVGGSHDGALVVRVAAPAVDGRATEAALAAVAEALGLRCRDVGLMTGATSRTKVVEVPDGLEEAVATLLERRVRGVAQRPCQDAVRICGQASDLGIRTAGRAWNR